MTKVREAARRLEDAEDKVESVARWLPVVERAVMDLERAEDRCHLTTSRIWSTVTVPAISPLLPRTRA